MHRTASTLAAVVLASGLAVAPVAAPAADAAPMPPRASQVPDKKILSLGGSNSLSLYVNRSGRGRSVTVVPSAGRGWRSSGKTTVSAVCGGRKVRAQRANGAVTIVLPPNRTRCKVSTSKWWVKAILPDRASGSMYVR